jgi:hypothetical protein
MTATVAGSGTGACAAACLLLASGWRVRMSWVKGTKPSWITLNEETVDLLQSLFGRSLDLPVKRRLLGKVVRIAGASLGVVPGGSVVVQVGELGESIQAALKSRFGQRVTWVDDSKTSSRCDVIAMPARHRRTTSSGERQAWQAEVELAGPIDHAVFETVLQGWLYLAPFDARNGSLHCVTCDVCDEPVHRMISESREVSARVAMVTRILPPLKAAAEFWWPDDDADALFCGGGLFRWDPICGDGTGASVRSGLLAGAGLKAIRAGERAVDVRQHVVRRSATAFAAHTSACESFYRSVSFGGAWEAEIVALVSAREEIGRTVGLPEWKYWLSDGELIRLAKRR